MSDRALGAAWIFGTLALVVYCALTLRLENSIAQFMPSGEEAELAEVSRRLIDSGLSRNMILSIGGGSDRTRVAAGLAKALAAHPEVASVRTGVNEEQLAELHALYYPRLAYLASDRPETGIPAMLTPEALASRARELRVRLARPSSYGAAQLAPGDPLAIFDAILERFQGTQTSLTLRDGQFVSTDGEHAILFLSTRHSPFESEHQAPLLAEIEARFAALDAAHGGGHVLEQSGVNRIAVATEQSMRGDVRFISTLSLLGVSALFLLFFRSPRSLGIAIFPPLAGVAFATACGIVAMSPLGGITFAFGVALIGVAIDYPIHVMNHHRLAPGASAADTVRRLRPSLLLGGATTIASFLGLAFTTFPGVAEMGIFAALGIAAALVVTLRALPHLLGGAPALRDPQRAIAAKLANALERLTARPRLLAIAPALALGVALSGLPALQWDDDPATLTTVDRPLAAEDDRVRARVAEYDNGRFVIALADDRETAIERNDRVWERLRAAIARGELEAARSLHALLWSESLQRRNLSALRAETGLARRIDAAFASEGFRQGAFGQFTAPLAAGAELPPPLRFEDLEGTPLHGVARTMLVELGDRHAAISYLRGVRDAEAIRERLSDTEGAFYFDQQELLHEIFAGYRSATLNVVLVSGVLVLAVLWLRYRRLRLALAAFLPSVLVCLATFGAFALCGVAVNLLGLISVILVMGMGVDYGIFVVDSARDSHELGATLVSLLLSCLTTVGVFGVLALSSHPALRSIGLTTGVGILLAFLLTPSALLLRPTTRQEQGAT